MDDPGVFDLETFPAHLGLGATAVKEPRFTRDGAWYAGYGARHAKDGLEGRLVAMHSFDSSWPMWEVHPHGAEMVICTKGEVSLIQEIDGKPRSVKLRAGEAAINPPGVWHTADVDGPCTLLFITPGVGTDHRPR